MPCGVKVNKRCKFGKPYTEWIYSLSHHKSLNALHMCNFQDRNLELIGMEICVLEFAIH
jgi:hypothetical protein